MKYYTNTNNELFASPTEKMILDIGLIEVISPIRDDGTILPNHSALDTLELDTNGNYYKYYNVDGTPDLAKIQAYLDATTLATWKADREALVAAIKVTTAAGNEFDGDEESQTRMSRAISVMDDVETTTWVLADNTTVDATKAELSEALKLAGQAQTALWVQ